MRHRPWKLLALLVFGTAAMVFFGIDLLDGEIETRRLGAAGIAETPVKYSALVIGYLACWGVIILGWIALYSEWNLDYRMPLKPPIDDPDRRSAAQ